VKTLVTYVCDNNTGNSLFTRCAQEKLYFPVYLMICARRHRVTSCDTWWAIPAFRRHWTLLASWFYV